MSQSAVFLVLSSFLASAVEAVEALTIVLAAGVARGWRSALVGVAAASVVLILVAILACWLPAVTASRTNPMQALREG